MGRKGAFEEKVRRGPGKKARKQGDAQMLVRKAGGGELVDVAKARTPLEGVKKALSRRQKLRARKRTEKKLGQAQRKKQTAKKQGSRVSSWASLATMRNNAVAGRN